MRLRNLSQSELNDVHAKMAADWAAITSKLGVNDPAARILQAQIRNIGYRINPHVEEQLERYRKQDGEPQIYEAEEDKKPKRREPAIRIDLEEATDGDALHVVGPFELAPALRPIKTKMNKAEIDKKIMALRDEGNSAEDIAIVLGWMPKTVEARVNALLKGKQ